MKLRDFIRSEQDAILHEWERILRGRRCTVGPIVSIWNCRELLVRIADMIEAAERGAVPSALLTEAPLQLGCAGEHRDLGQQVMAYTALRECIIRLWHQAHPNNDSDDQFLFHQLLDNTITASVEQSSPARDPKARASSDERSRALLEHAGDMIMVLGSDGTVLYQSPSCERVLGYGPAEAVGQTGIEFVHVDDRAEAYCMMEEVIRTGGVRRAELRVQHKDGSWHYVEAVGARFSADDDPNALIITSRDITDRKRAEEEVQRARQELERRVHERTAALSRSEGRLNAIIRSASEAIISIDHEQRIVLFNDAAEKTFGIPAAQAIGQPLDRFIPDRFRTAHRSYVAAFGESGTSNRTMAGERVVYGRRADGEEFPIEAHISSVVIGGERTYTVVLRDITERQQHVAAQAELNELLSCAHAFVRDFASGRILSWTAGATALYGWTSEEACGANSDDLLKTEFPESLAQIAANITRDGQWEGELVHTRRDGTRIVVASHWTVRRDLHSQPAAIVEVNNDITAIKNAEEALREANRHKDEFLAMLAHELRNPLVPIRNGVRVLQLIGPPEAKLVHTREMIDRQVAHMSRLLDDLLDVSRITRGLITLHKEPVDLLGILEQAVQTMQPIFERRGLHLAISLPGKPCPVEADPARLLQVFSNLLGNAIKFTPRGGRVSISASCTPDQIAVRLTDTGVGIASEALGRIFDLFAQEAPALDRREGGLGIGLTLVKRIVELHGGTVRASSAGPGRGSDFVVTLPAHSGEVVRTGPTRHAPPESSLCLRLLVVEDNPDVAESTAMLLEMAGHEVRLAADAREALEVLRQHPVDVAFIDIGLPGMNGYDLARQLRGSPAPDRPILVALSGYGQEEDKQRAKAAGFEHHLTKPVDPDNIIALLNQLHARANGARTAPPSPPSASSIRT